MRLIIVLIFVCITVNGPFSIAAAKPAKSGSANVQSAAAFSMRMGHSNRGTEEYKITTVKDGYMLTSTLHLLQNGEKISSQQQEQLAPDWSPVTYSLKTSTPKDQRTTEASLQGVMIHMKTQAREGTREKSIQVDPPTLVLDNVAPSHFQVLLNQYSRMLSPAGIEVQLLAPQVLGQFTGRFKRVGAEQGFLQNRPIDLQKYILETRGLNIEVWSDMSGKLMRVYLQPQDTEFLRQGFSMNKASASPAPLAMKRR